MKFKNFFATFQILGPLGCQGWVVIPQNVKKSQNHCTLKINSQIYSNDLKLNPLRTMVGQELETSISIKNLEAKKRAYFAQPKMCVVHCSGSGGSVS
jgi:hypothetical protein